MSYSAQLSRAKNKRKNPSRRSLPGRPRINPYNCYRDVACEQLAVPYGRVHVGVSKTIIDALGDQVVIGEAIEGLTSFEMLPEGHGNDAFITGDEERELDEERQSANEMREMFDAEYRLVRAANRFADAIALGQSVTYEL